MRYNRTFGGRAYMNYQFPLSNSDLRRFCERNAIRSLAIFGSAIHGDFTQDSDVDVLVEFEPGKTPGLRFFALQNELSELLGRRVDLNTPGFLSKYFRDAVLAEAKQLYAKD